MRGVTGSVRRRIRLLLCLIATELCFTSSLSLRGAVSLDPQFDSGPGTELFAEDVVPLPDGKILVCGQFRWYDLQQVPYLIRLNENGVLDTSFQTGVVNDWVRHMTVQPDGKILVAGAFSSAGGLSRNLIARLNPDGSLDPSFDPGTGFEEKLVPADPNPPYVFWLALQPDGKIIVVGSFAIYNGQAARGIARLNADGSLDRSFQMGVGLDSWGRFAVVQPNGQILVTGWFTDYNGFACNRMVRLNPDGTPDGGFRPYFGDKTAIYHAALLPDGKMLVSGHSKSDFNLFKREVARLNPDGSEDATFLAHTDNRTESIFVQPDGKFLVCGWFDYANDTPRRRIARFNADGSLDDSFRADADFFVWNMALDAKGRLLIVGGFPVILGIQRLGIARLIEESQVEQDPKSNPGLVLISGARMVNGNFEVTIPTANQKMYYLETREDFDSGQWQPIDVVPGDGTARTLTDFSPGLAHSCYRVRRQ